MKRFALTAVFTLAIVYVAYAADGTTSLTSTTSSSGSLIFYPTAEDITAVTTTTSGTLTTSGTSDTDTSGTSGGTSGSTSSGDTTISATNTTGTYTTTNTSYTSTYTTDSQKLTETTLDSAPPTVPVNLRATDITTSGFKLSWDSSHDPYVSGQYTSGLAGYKIYRIDGGSIGALSNYLLFTGLQPGTIYSFTIVSYDRAGNVSAPSARINVATASGEVYTNSQTTYASSTFSKDYTYTLKELYVRPGTVTLNTGESVTFSAYNGQGEKISAVWSVESGGGYINSSGIYKAPSQAGVYHVIAKYLGYFDKKVTVYVVTPVNIVTHESPENSTTLDSDRTANSALPPEYVLSTTSVSKPDDESTADREFNILATTSPLYISSELERISDAVEIIESDVFLSEDIEKTIVSSKVPSSLRDEVLSLYKDTNSDGISDYDSKHFYNIDPVKPAPVSEYQGRTLTAGEKVQLGFDPTKSELVKIVHEEPIDSFVPPTQVYEVKELKLNEEKKVVVRGKALPNSLVTIYIYSTPLIVTIKAGANGEWEYTVDKELETGEHKIYTASVNNSGKIVARSPEFTFVKTAEAVTLTEFARAEEIITPENPSLIEGKNIYYIGAIFFGLIILSIGLIPLMSRNTEPQP